MIGQTVDHYRITEKLGEGGMGEVYLAEDASLRRKVALKFLPAFLEYDETARKRFVREARSAAAIDHPYICKIYEVGEVDNKHFIAMEYVEGQELREKMSEGRLPLKEALRIASQIAGALAEAHQKGIVHRDLKPANIMISTGGHTKVMDFGLAKRLEREDEDITAALTREGTTLGTLAYMSPEQLRGKPLDTRSDIFSFGVVLYEMLTGIHPFRTGTQAETINSILNEHPSAISRYTEDTSDILQHTVEKMLAKDPDERYQLIHDVRTNLKKLYERLGVSGVLSGEIYPKAKTKPWLWMVAGAAGVALAAILLYLYTPSISLPQDHSASLGPIEVVPLTSLEGYERSPALSPDGRQVVFSRHVFGAPWRHLYLKLVGRAETIPLTRGEGIFDSTPAWHPDGSVIAFQRKTRGSDGFHILTVSALGGEPQLLTTIQGSRVTPAALDYSADGETLAYVDRPSPSEQESIFLLSTKTGEKRRLTTPQPFRRDQESVDARPVFSPDGTKVAFSRCLAKEAGGCALFVQPLDQEAATQLGPITRFYDLAWSADGNSIISIYAEGSSNTYFLRNFLDGEEAVRLPFGDRPLDLSISKRGARMAYTNGLEDENIVRIGGPSALTAVSPEEFISSTRTDGAAAYSPDGEKIAFFSDRSGTLELWLADPDGSDPRQITYLGDASQPKWSPSGDRILFRSVGSKIGDGGFNARQDLYIIPATGGIARRLPPADGVYPGYPSWSADGRSIYFSSESGGVLQIWRRSLDSDEIKQLTHSKGDKRQPKEWQGRIVYSKEGKLWSFPTDGDEEELEVDKQVGAWCLWNGHIVFMTSDSLVDDRSQWLQVFETFDLESRETTRFATIQGLENWLGSNRIDVSPDGSWLLGMRLSQRGSDLMLVENFR